MKSARKHGFRPLECYAIIIKINLIYKSMARGGKQPGAGRPKGAKTKKTLQQMAVTAAFNQRILRSADALFNAQLSLAVGSVKVFRVDEVEENGKTKKIHTLITDPDEIKEVLDQIEGVGSGSVKDSFYFVSEVAPDNKAIDSMLNRGLGKPKDVVEIQATPEVEAGRALYETLVKGGVTPKQALKQVLTGAEVNGFTLKEDDILNADTVG